MAGWCGVCVVTCIGFHRIVQAKECTNRQCKLSDSDLHENRLCSCQSEFLR